MSFETQAALLGLGTGLGLFLLWWAAWVDERPEKKPSRWQQQARDVLNQAGLPHTRVGTVVLVSAAAGGLVTLVVAVSSGSLPIGICFGLFAAGVPALAIRYRAHTRQVHLRALWPEAIDHLISGVRAGLSLAEALSGLATRGPEGLRPHFAYFAREYRSSGNFVASVERFKAHSADPVADRVAEALILTRQVGGTDLGTMLRTLASFLREDARTRSELVARQQWTVAGARLAVAAPWLILGMLATQPQAAAAYNQPAGVALLVFGLVASVGAYQLMRRIGRLPDEPRVLR